MGGSSGGGTFKGRSPDQLRELVRKAEGQATEAAFDGELARMLGELLAGYNGRDTALVRERLEELKEALSEELDSSIDQFFGGSVAKHTYVDGLSDIDSLLVINDPDLREEKPKAVLTRMEGILKEEIGTAASVSHGRMAVTVEYRDGMVIQLLPAIETEGDHVHVPSSLTEGWAKINPLAFQQALTKRNEQCAGKLVPTIKLAKAIVGQLTLPSESVSHNWL
jgi:predicted nucleotidyltransferase